MEKKGPFTVHELRQLEPGNQIWGKFLVTEKTTRKTKEGKTIINLKIGDKSGEIHTVVWENCQLAGVLATGAVVGLMGDLGVFNNNLQVTAKRIKILEEDPAPYMKGPQQPIELLKEELDHRLQSVEDPYMKALLSRIFTPSLWQEYLNAPAAKAIHHNYSGGLIEHTLTVVKLCEQAAGLYPGINRDLMITGAVLHDIGKIQEFHINVMAEYTEIGRMVGHIVLGHELLSHTIGKIREEGLDFPLQLENMLKHMILSHHGTMEFGSPVVPLFPEAMLLHSMDDLDAKMYIFFNKIADFGSGETPFTPYDSFHQQHFYTSRYHHDSDKKG